jgi:hypothetical protein
VSLSAAQIARNRLAAKRRSDPTADVTELRRDLVAVTLEEHIWTAARVRRAARWALVVEAVGYNPRAGNLIDVVHTFGNCLMSGAPGIRKRRLPRRDGQHGRRGVQSRKVMIGITRAMHRPVLARVDMASRGCLVTEPLASFHHRDGRVRGAVDGLAI